MSSESEPSYEEQVAAEERQQQRVNAYNYDASQFLPEAKAFLGEQGITSEAEITAVSVALAAKAATNKSGNAVRWMSDLREVVGEHKTKTASDRAKAMLTMPEADFKTYDSNARTARAALARQREQAKEASHARAKESLAKEVETVTLGRGIFDLSDKEFAELDRKHAALRRQRIVDGAR